jgi:hypothetical protein
MKARLYEQLQALRQTLELSRQRNTNTATDVGITLNKIRKLTFELLSSDEKVIFEELVGQVKTDKHYPYSLITQDGLRLCAQLMSYLKPSPVPAERDAKIQQSTASGIDRLVPNSKNIFVIHGRDEANTYRLRTLLKERFDLNPIILREQPGKGRSIIEKFEEEASSITFAIALLTPDDQIQFEKTEYAQARPNVVFELGWFYGRLGRDRVCILFKKGTQIHSDLHGINRVEFQENVEEALIELERELRAAHLIK